MSLHTLSESERQRASITRARLERLGIKRITMPVNAPAVVPPPKPEPIQSRVESAAQFYAAGWRCIQALEGPSAPRTPTCNEIILTTAHYYGITNNEIRNARRTMNFTKPRQIAYYLCCELTRRSLVEIGVYMGGKDHTTVLHGNRKIRSLLTSDPDLAAEIDQLISVLRPVSPEDEGNAEINRADRS